MDRVSKSAERIQADASTHSIEGRTGETKATRAKQAGARTKSRETRGQATACCVSAYLRAATVISLRTHSVSPSRGCTVRSSSMRLSSVSWCCRRSLVHEVSCVGVVGAMSLGGVAGPPALLVCSRCRLKPPRA